jgi:hypothetical protein
MSQTSGQLAGNVRPAVYESPEQNYAIVLKRTFEHSAEELVWIAELMSGSRQAAEQCIAEAVQLAETAQYVGPEWILPWVKRVLVQFPQKDKCRHPQVVAVAQLSFTRATGQTRLE